MLAYFPCFKFTIIMVYYNYHHVFQYISVQGVTLWNSVFIYVLLHVRNNSNACCILEVASVSGRSFDVIL